MDTDKSMTVMVATQFFSALTSLSKREQAKVISFANKFIQNPALPGYNYEKIATARDQRLRSVRVDDSCRCILLKQDIGNIYMLLWVDKHDAAYAWASNRRCEIDPVTGGIQIVLLPEIEPKLEPAPTSTTGLFFGLKDDDLKALGIPKKLWGRVRAITVSETLGELEGYLSASSYEALCLLASGESLAEVLEACFPKEEPTPKEEVKQPEEEPKVEEKAKPAEEEPKPEPKDETDEQQNVFSEEELSRALTNPYTLAQFKVNPDEKELIDMLNAPLEKWRVFLHPEQRSLVEHDWNGPVRVLGGAGTGKTVAALHRAKWLAANRCAPNEKILFTTFTSTLAVDLQRQLASICTDEELAKIEVVNLDRWVIDFLRRNSYDYTIVYSDKNSESLWNKAKSVLPDSSPVKDLPLNFFREEWERVIQPQEVMTVEEYFKATRKGRGRSITRKERKAIWPVMEEFRIILNERKERQPADAMREARQFIEKNLSHTPYKSIIVDEAQDMSPQALKLLRALAPVGKNDLFLVGDAHQRIYGQPISLSACGINIIGRGKKLRLNYRTTEEIRQEAVKFLDDGLSDDLDGNKDSLGPYTSLTHGVLPVNEQFANFEALLANMQEQIKAFQDVPNYVLRNICVTVRTNAQVEKFEEALSKLGIKTYALSAENPDAADIEGVRIATMHRVKGLEFDVIFLVMKQNELERTYEDQVRQEQEKSLRYVAATRARKGLFIYTYCGKAGS